MALADLLLGQRPEDVSVPTFEATARRRSMLEDLLAREATGRGGPTLGELIARSRTDAAVEDVARQQQSVAAGARGFGGLAARLQAAQNIGQAEQALRSRGAATEAEQRFASTQAARAGLEDLLRSQEQAELQKRQLQAQGARGGLLPALLGVGGAAVGGRFGGAQGARTGFQLGVGVGEQFRGLGS